MFRFWDLTAIVIFLAGMAGMGLWFARKNSSTEAYFLGNRSFPGWAVGISMLGTSISSVTFLALPAAAYILDYRQAVPNMALPLVAVIAVFFFIPLFRQGNMTSAFEYLEKRYGILVRAYAALSFLVLQLVRLAVILYLVAIPVEGMLGIPILWVIVVGGLVVSLYTVFGGIEAVVWTDVVQTFILLGGGLVCLGLMVWEIPGGIGRVIDLGVEYHKFGLGPVKFDLNERTFFAVLLLGLVNFTNEYASNQNVVQRYIASKSLREARKATLICMFMSVPTWMSFFFLGSCLFAFYHVFPEPAVAAMAADEVLPHFILTKTPPFVGGLIIAACLAAAMSSQSSSINAISTICTVDFFKRFGRPRSDREYLTIAKLTAGVASLLMIAGAIVICYIPKESINDFSLIIGSLFGGGVLSIFLLGFFTTRVGYRAVLLGTGVALACNVYLMLNTFGWLPEALKLPVHSYWTTIIVNAVLLPVGYGAALFWPNRRNLNHLTVWAMERKARKSPQLIPDGVKEP